MRKRTSESNNLGDLTWEISDGVVEGRIPEKLGVGLGSRITSGDQAKMSNVTKCHWK